MKKSIILCGVSLVALSMMVTSCNQEAPKGSPASKVYKTMTIGYGTSSIDTKYSASIRGQQFVDIRPQVSGIITDILIKEGANVQKGQTLFVIDQVPYQAALDVAVANVKAAEASVATAKLNAESGAELYKEAVISKVEYQTYVNTLASAEANLALMEAQESAARNDLSYTEVKSPVNGMASMIPYRIGTLVSSSITEPLVSVSNNTNMYAYFTMSESQLLALMRVSLSNNDMMSNMDRVELILRDGEVYEHLGEVDAISGVIDRTTGTVGMRAMFPNYEQMLRDGGSGSIVVTTKMDSVIVLPKIATYEIQNKLFAFKVVDGKAESTQLDVYPYNNGKEYVVESGLDIGDIVIAEGAGLLREGTPIEKTENQSEK